MNGSRPWCRWCGHWVSEHEPDGGPCRVCDDCPEPVTAWPLSLEQVAVLVALVAVVIVLVAWGVRWWTAR